MFFTGVTVLKDRLSTEKHTHVLSMIHMTLESSLEMSSLDLVSSGELWGKVIGQRKVVYSRTLGKLRPVCPISRGVHFFERTNNFHSNSREKN